MTAISKKCVFIIQKVIKNERDVPGLAGMPFGERSAEWIQPAQVLPQEWIDDAPVAAAEVLDDARAFQALEDPVTDGGRKTPRWGLSEGHAACDRQSVLVRAPDLLHGLLHCRQVTVQCRLIAELDHVKVDQPLGELDRDEMGLLSDPHGRPGMRRSAA
jgi:hypothetical protein